MNTSINAFVNPPLLVWTREESGYAPEWVANRLKIKPERLQAWEQGEIKPTARQARQPAKFYHRPFGVFFLRQPPRVCSLATKFRVTPLAIATRLRRIK